MELLWLEDFLAVVEEEGFSRAAERRGVSQPAFSRRIKALEDWIGASLLDRSTHSVQLTAAGERFRPAAEEIIRRVRVAREDARGAAQGQSETLRLAATHALSMTFFPAWLRALETIAPITGTVQLTADTMTACEKLMLEGRAHFLLCHDHPAATTRLAPDGFYSVEVGRDFLVPVAEPSLLREAAPERLPYIAYTAESGMGRILAAAWASVGRSPPAAPAFSSHLASVIAAMARAGRGLSWSPLSLVAEDIAAGRLARAGGTAEDVPMGIRLFRPKARQSLVAEALWERAVSLGGGFHDRD